MKTQQTQRSLLQRSVALATIVAAAVLLSACGSSVDLNPQAGAPVDDRTGSSGTTQSGGAPGSQVGGNSLSNPLSADQAASLNLIKVVYFDFDSAAVRPEFNAGMEAQAQHLRADRTRRLKLEGHTDERGGSEYNLALGQQRAESVRRSLSALGVSDAQIEAVSYGKEKLAVQGTDESAHAQNRRVELVP
jgi:peptidoglycan-associated lipoprotein